MRNLLLFLLSILIFSPLFAQKNIIKEAEVARIVKILSSDEMQGRATFTPGIEKAGAFIQEEFRKIGLQFLPGLNSFEQQFKMYKVQPLSIEMQLNGVNLPAESYFASSATEEINWNSNNTQKPELISISAADNFIQVAGYLINQEKNQLVLVDPSHAALFKRYKAYINRSNLKSQKNNFATVFVITNQPEIKNYNIFVRNKLVEQELANIVGYLPGKSKIKEFVLFSAHYDHLGVVKAVNGDSIANGADDDASGTTAVIALAKYFREQQKNERSLIFVAFTAEEIGGYGSQYFSKQLNPDQVVAMFNIEMIGKESQFGPNAGFITGFERSDLGSMVQKNLKGTGYQFHPDPYTNENLFYRSDNATLARLGVPAHSLSSDKIDTDKLYHSVDDEFESLNIPNMTNIIRAIALGARSIVSGKDTPARVAPEH